MKRALAGALMFAAALSGCSTSISPTASQYQPATVSELLNGVEIPYDRFTLDNGLTVLVHEDRKAPIVAIAAWYNIGSKDEPVGQAVFSHLF
jgi:hypothetical protein